MSAIATEYQPKALYFEDADSLEYVRTDEPHIYRRVDEFLTLILSLESRKPVGFKIKGFKNFFLRSIRPKFLHSAETDFVRMKLILEEVMTEIGNELFLNSTKGEAYRIAAEIAENDQVLVSDFPAAA